MINIQRIQKQDRTMKAFTGLTVKEFQGLLPQFKKTLDKLRWGKYQKNIKQRTRKPGGGAKGELRTSEIKLIFILLYFKCYPTFDLLGIIFNLDRSNAKRNVDYLGLVLEKTLGVKQVLPKRKISSLEEFFKLIPEAKDLFVDGTERLTQRPGKKQRKYYSGKKKTHTRNNLIINTAKRKIVYLGKTKPGKHVDYGMFKQEFNPDHIPKKVTLWFDKGFQGVKKDYPDLDSVLPKRKPRNKSLNQFEKEQNKTISSIRILSEHAIGGIKRFRILSDRFRNHSDEFSDKTIFLSCGLWNWHLKNC